MARLVSFIHDRSGTAAAEMAMMVPLLLALTFMMLEGANWIWNEHKVVMGVRDAARYASRLDFSKYSCPSTIDNTSLAAIKNMARTGQISGGNSRISGWVDADVTVSLSCTSQGGLYNVVGGSAPLVKVVAKVKYPSIVATTLGIGSSVYMGAASQSAVMGL